MAVQMKLELLLFPRQAVYGKRTDTALLRVVSFQSAVVSESLHHAAT
jgi:hypothetical protein